MKTRWLIKLLVMLALARPAGAAVINVFLLGGQSNMEGWADGLLLASDLKNQPDVIFFSNTAGNFLTTLQPRTDGRAGNFGPELTFGRGMADYYAASGGQVALIKYAAGGTNLHTQWHADGTTGATNDGSEYRNFQNIVATALATLRGDHQNDTIIIRGMIWMQGESDVVDGPATSAAYAQNLTAFISDIRANYGADLRFVIGELSVNQTYMNATNLGTVRQGQESVAAADPLTGIVSTNGFTLNSDRLHFNDSGQLALGYAFATEMQILLAIPEPATWLLLGVGAALLAALRRRG